MEWQQLWEAIPGKEHCSQPVEYKVAASDEVVGLAFTRKCESAKDYDRVSKTDRHSFLQVFILDLNKGDLKAKLQPIPEASRIELLATARGNFLLSWWTASNLQKLNTTKLLLLTRDAKVVKSVELSSIPDSAFPSIGCHVLLSPTRRTLVVSCPGPKQSTYRAFDVDSLEQKTEWTMEGSYGPDISTTSDTDFIAGRKSGANDGFEPAVGHFGETNSSAWRPLPRLNVPRFFLSADLMALLESNVVSRKKMSEARIEVLDLGGQTVARKVLRSSRWDYNYVFRDPATSSNGAVFAVQTQHSSRFIVALDTFGALHAELHVLRRDTLEELLRTDASRSPNSFCLSNSGTLFVLMNGPELSAFALPVSLDSN